jgi:hypothetical protein
MRLPSCLLVWIALLCRCSLAAEPKPTEARQDQGATGSIAGSIVPHDGAEVTSKGYRLLIQPVRSNEQPAAPRTKFETIATVDERGHFLFDGLPPGRYIVRPAEPQDLPIFVDASAEIQLREAERLEGIKLHPKLGRQLHGRVVDRVTGKGIESVEINVYSHSKSNVIHLRPARTDAEGRFSAWFLPGQVRVAVSRVPTRYLRSLAESERGAREFSGNEWPPIELERAAKLEGRVVDEQGNPVPLARLDIQCVPSAQFAPLARTGIRSAPARRSGALAPLPEEADQLGRFSVEQLDPAEQVSLRARSATAASEAPLIVVPADAGGPIELVISEKRACWLSGQIVDREGRSVPGAKIFLFGLHIGESANAFRTRRTFLQQDVAVLPDGSFETEALWPGDDYQLQVTAPGYSDLRTASVHGEVGKRHDFGPLRLDAFATFTGQVVDAAGRPAANAELRVFLPSGSPQPNGGLIGLECDDEGRFALPEMNVAGTLRVWARAGRATTNGPETFFPDLIQGPLKIVVSEEHAFRVSGQVVDRHGSPLPAAVDVMLQVERAEGVFNRFGRVPEKKSVAISQLSFSLGGTTLKEDGGFVTGGLWPDQRYHLLISADGYLPVESRTFSGRGGETADAGRFELRRTGLTLDGEVVDAAGQPVAGATVFNSGDAEQPLTATTDVAGRFRLEGLNEGPVYLLVRKPGFWPAGLRASTSDAGTRVRLVDQGRPRPESHLPSADDAADAEDRELARRLLNELWEVRHRILPNDNSRGRAGAGVFGSGLILPMAAIDFNQAMRWSAALGGAYDETLRRREINRLIHDGVDQAIERADAPGRDDSLKWMARSRLAAGDRDGAIRLLERARQADLRLEASGLEARFVISSQAEVGALALAAGREEWGIGLINEAADRVEASAGDAPEVPESLRDAKTRATVAAALATFDPGRSVQLWELSSPPHGSDDNYALELAVALAPRDLRAARRVAPAGPFKRLDRGFVVESNTFIPVARRLARSQPEAALELLDEIKEVDRLERAETLGRIAMGMAPHDSPKAFELIDQALALCSPVSRPEQNAIVEVRRAECGARIALLAEKAGYPDMKSIIAQVLALRLTPDEQPSAELRAEALINAARPLALLDREAARALLSGVPRPPAPTDERARESKLATWLEAWTLVDVAQADKRFHEVLADEGPRISAEYVDSGLLPMIRLLSTPPDDREQALFPTTSYWISPPGDD